MRPPRYATNWERSVCTCIPFQPTVSVRGRSVVSARHGTPSTLPTRIAEWSLLIGKSGLVTLTDAEEKDGAIRSTRREAGASLRRVRVFNVPSGGCGIERTLGEPRLRGSLSTAINVARPAAAATPTTASDTSVRRRFTQGSLSVEDAPTRRTESNEPPSATADA